MAWTSGRPGRRQLIYQVPRQLIPELDSVTRLKLTLDGTWHRGSKAKEQAADLEQKALVEGDPEYEEVVLRFNKSQSVLPGSPHPDTGGRYRFLNYNEGKVEPAPGWVLDALRPFRKPVQWLPDSVQQELDAELGGQTVLPPRQIRGWFFKEEVQAKLRPRLADLVFRHEAFERYGWKERGGDNPQMMSGCPWHGGKSGTSFQFSKQSGCWDCKACEVGGDLLDFIHKIKVDNLYAGKPTGADLEKYVADLAGEIGFNYPEDAQAQVTKEVPRHERQGLPRGPDQDPRRGDEPRAAGGPDGRARGRDGAAPDRVAVPGGDGGVPVLRGFAPAEREEALVAGRGAHAVPRAEPADEAHPGDAARRRRPREDVGLHGPGHRRGARHSDADPRH
jgi:hypothetical protein